MEYKLRVCSKKMKSLSELVNSTVEQEAVDIFQESLNSISNQIEEILALQLKKIPSSPFIDDFYVHVCSLESTMQKIAKKNEKIARAKAQSLFEKHWKQLNSKFTSIFADTPLSTSAKYSMAKASEEELSDILDPEGRNFWSGEFGDIPSVSLDQFLKSYSEFVLLEDEGPVIKMIIDPAHIGVITTKRFGHFLRAFGPLRNSLNNAKDLMASSWFSGYITSSESAMFLCDAPVGSYLVRFQEKAPSNFMLAYVKQDLSIGEVNISPEATEIIQFSVRLHTEEKKFFGRLKEALDYCILKLNLTQPFSSTLWEKIWFHRNTSTGEAQELLSTQPTGTFLVKVNSQLCCFELSVSEGNGSVLHLAIKFSRKDGFQLAPRKREKTEKEMTDKVDKPDKWDEVESPCFKTLNELVNYYCSKKKLKTPYFAPNASFENFQVTLLKAKSAQELTRPISHQLPSDNTEDTAETDLRTFSNPEVSPSSSSSSFSRDYSTPTIMRRGTTPGPEPVLRHFMKRSKSSSVAALDELRSLELRKKRSMSSLTMADEGEEVQDAPLDWLVAQIILQQKDYSKAFLLTYRSFTTAVELFREMKLLYMSHIDDDDDDEDENKTTKNKFARLRICNFLKNWLKNHHHDFETDDELQESLSTFAEQTIARVEGPGICHQLVNLLAQSSNRRKEVMFSTFPPTPKLPIPNFSVFDLEPDELARQMTLLEFELYRMIHPKECFNSSWTKINKESASPNLIKSSNLFNTTSMWIVTTIVSEPDLKKRTKNVEFWIKVMAECRNINNYNGVMEVLSALNNSSVCRLQKTFEAVSKDPKRILSDYNILMSPEKAYKSYREALQNAVPPLIPYVGVFLTDLTFIEGGNPNTLTNGHINFRKCIRIAKVIESIQNFQQSPYNVWPIESVQKYLSEIVALTDEQCYEKSLQVEPRRK